MKIVKTIAAVCIISVSLFAQNIPNPSFETWTNNYLLGPYPNGWFTTNAATLDRTLGFGTSQTADAILGSSAAKITTGHMYYAAFGIDDTAALLMSGSFNILQQREYPGFPCTLRPTALRCQYKYFPMPPLGQDTGRIYVHFHKWNAGNGAHDIIGVGELKLTDTVAAYTPVDVSITWSSSDAPDSAHIELASSLNWMSEGYDSTDIRYPLMGTTLYVDALEFVMAVDARPARDRMVVAGWNAAGAPAGAALFDLSGRARAPSGRAPLKPGAYILRSRNAPAASLHIGP